MPSPFKVRPYRHEDLPGVLRLWEEHSGWGAISERQWHEWYMDTPWGESVVIIVEDLEQGIVGQGVSTPFPLRVNDELGVAYRISAPILKTEVRAGKVFSPDHPSRRMLELCLSTIRSRGAIAAYAMPLLAWRGFFNRIPGFQLQEYGCGRIDLSSRAASGDTDLEVDRADAFGLEHSNLWQQAVVETPIQLALDRGEALWNYRLRQQLVLNVRTKAGELMGYLAVKRETGLVVDLLARSPSDARVVINAAVHALVSRREEFGHDLPALKLMLTPQIASHMEELGAESDDFRFLFCICALANGVDAACLSPDNWYLTAGD